MNNQEIIADLLARMMDADWHKRDAGTVERDVYEWLRYNADSLAAILTQMGITWQP